MPRRVLFAIPPALGDLAANHEGSAGMGALSPDQSVYAYPPHTVALCAQAARSAGWTVTVVDGAGSATAEVARSVAETDTDVLAVLVAAGTAEADLTFLNLLRHARRQSARRAPVLLFGPSAGLATRDWVTNGPADALLAGEPEAAIAIALELTDAGARGVLAAAELRPDACSPGGLLRDLDALPFPAWDLVPWQPYKMVSLLSGRGCPAGCRYCAYTLTQGATFRTQSLERIVAEWTWLAEEVRPPYLVVRDPVFAHDRGRVAALCEAVAGLKRRLGWACESRPEHFDRELIRSMGAVGCATIKIGMESGDPGFLARIGRVARPEAAAAYLDQVVRVSQWCHEAGVRCRIFLMVGMPDQPPAAIEATVAALKRAAPSATIHPNVYRAYDGVALQGFNLPVAPATLQAIREANRPAPSFLTRSLAAARRRLPAATAPGASGPALIPVSQPAEVLRPDATAGILPRQYLLAGSRVFLTGGSGFVGGYVARALAAAGAEVVALLRPGAPPGALAELPLQIARGDLTDPSSWTSALRGCSFCFHVAALYGSQDLAAAMFAVNARATGYVLAAAAEAGVARFIHTSTIGTVGRPDGPGHASELPDESTPFNLWERASHYVRSKRLGELIAQSWSGTGMDVVIVKPTAPVGAGDGTAARPPTATGRRIRAALRGQPFSYPPGGVNHAPVRDIAMGHLLAAERGQRGESYILGHAGGNLDRAAFMRLLGLAPDAPARRGSGSSAPAGPEALTANPARAIRELGLPQSDLAAAFVEAVAWRRSGASEEQERAVAL